MTRPTTRRVISLPRRVFARLGAAKGAKHLDHYRVVVAEPHATSDPGGWKERSVAELQHGSYAELLEEMYLGRPRLDLVVAAEAVTFTGIREPTIVEVGCGTGYYSEVFTQLLEEQIVYVGIDYALEMVRKAHSHYPAASFVAADGTRLPLADSSADIVLNGVSLMHIMDYDTAIREAARVARHFCIFHTVPLTEGKQTLLSKNAYGAPVLEIIFNERDLVAEFERAGLIVRKSITSIPYNLQPVIGESTSTRTFVCEKLDREAPHDPR